MDGPKKKSSECSLEFNLNVVATLVDAQLIAQGQAVSDYELVFAWGFYHDEDSPILIFWTFTYSWTNFLLH